MHTSIFFCGPADCTHYSMELLYWIFYWIIYICLNVMLWGKYLCSETSGAVRKTGGNFKEKLREHGGLDAVFDVTMNCHSDLKVWACMLVQVQYSIRFTIFANCSRHELIQSITGRAFSDGYFLLWDVILYFVNPSPILLYLHP